MRNYSFIALLAAFGALSTACATDPVDNTDPPDTQSTATKLTVEIKNVADWKYLKSGSYNTPVGKDAPGPIFSGNKYEVTFTAGMGHRLSFADMFGASNDWFFATQPEGIDLYPDGKPLNGDVTAQIHLYDAGTEIDQEPGVGMDTGPKQSSPEQGAEDPDKMVREIVSPVKLSDGKNFELPMVSEMIKVSIAPTGTAREFKLTIENVSKDDTLMTSAGPAKVGVSPGVFVIHGMPDALFTLGQPDRKEGLEWIAESGRIDMLKEKTMAGSGVATGFSPLVYVVHESGMPLFSEGSADRGQGLESIAESGDISKLGDALAEKLPEGASMSGMVNMPEGAAKPGPIRPGDSFSFQIEAMPGDKLSIASMFGASNDWFVGFGPEGLPLFDAAGKPMTGDVTSSLMLWDVGTEMSEELAVGPNTGPQQPDPAAGEADADKMVREVDAAAYGVPLSKHLMITISTSN